MSQLRSNRSAPHAAPAAAFGEDAVGLDAAGVYLEDKCPFLVVEGVEVKGDAVIGRGLIPRRQAGPDRLGVGIKAAQTDIQAVLVVPEIDLGLLRGHSSLEGFELGEILDQSAALPEWIVEHAVDTRWDGELRDADRVGGRRPFHRLGGTGGQGERKGQQDKGIDQT